MRYQGSCHCGRIAFEVEATLDKAIECNCSHCQRKGYLLAFVPREALALSTPEDRLATYTFNTHRLKHRFCPDCGCAPFAEGERAGQAMAGVNIRCLEGIDLAAIERVAVDGRSR
ncbi:MAG TPA: GFA family protein [Hyphomicrobiales bacterium]|nr:GFA family protein [Hyphomicrobiales bacterium]